MLTWVLVWWFATLTGTVSIAADSSSQLPAQYRKWLEKEVTYIISPVERKIYLKL